jgi:hypothetical protein
MTRRPLSGLAIAAVMAAIPSSRAEVPPMSEAELSRTADLIVSGRVAAVHSWMDERGEYVDARYTVAIDVGSIEKGEIKGNDKRIEFHAWRMIRRPRYWVGNGGTLRVDLKEGDNIKVYLTGGPESWGMFSRSGIEILH